MKTVRFFCCIIVSAAACLAPQNASAATGTSITQYGITWTFNTSHEYGQYANGDYWVVGPVTFSAITPAFDGSYNGWESNPSTVNTQGFDTRVSGFDAGLVPNLPYTAQPGESVVKGISVGAADTDCRPCLRTAGVLTVVSAAPAGNGAEVFRPGYFGTDKTVHTYGDVQFSKLPSELNPAVYPVKPSLTDIAGWFRRVQLDHLYDWGVRKLHPAENMPDYGADIVNRTAQAACRLMMLGTETEKKQALINYIQYGIDIYNIVKGGGGWPPNGGHGSGRKLPLVFAAVMLDNQAMKDLAGEEDPAGANFQENGMVQYSAKADGGNGKVLWGQNGGSETQYWQLIVTGDGFRTGKDPYRYIDGGPVPGGSYQLCCNSNPWRGTAMAGLLLPEVRQVWNDEEFYQYVDRWINFGAWAQDDPCAPVPDGITTWPAAGYEVTFGPDGSGDCIRDTDPSDGIGRFPDAHGSNKNLGDYGTRFYDFLVAWNWNTLYAPVHDNRTVIREHGIKIKMPAPFITGRDILEIRHENSEKAIDFTVFRNNGSTVYQHSGNSIRWNGTNQSGTALKPGMYVLRVGNTIGMIYRNLLITE